MKLINDSFNKSPNKEIKENLNEKELDTLILENTNKLISIKAKYDEIKSNWKALKEDMESLSMYNRVNCGEDIKEQFQKAIDDLKMDYRDTKATLDTYKAQKNKLLLEDTLSEDPIIDESEEITNHPEYLIDVDKDEVETLGECVVNESYLREASHLIPKEWKRKVLIVEDEASIECVLSTVVNTTSNTLNGGSEVRSVSFRVITDSIPSSFGISFFDEDKQKEFYESVPKKFDSIKQFIDYLVDIYKSYPRTSALYNIENIAKDLGYEDKDEKVEESYNYFEDDPKSEFDDDELDAYCKGYSDAANEDDGLITISDEFENKE